LLAAIERKIIGGLALEEGGELAGVVAAGGVLDLDDTRPQLGQHHRAVRAGKHAGQINDENAGKRAGSHGSILKDKGRRTKDKVSSEGPRILSLRLCPLAFARARAAAISRIRLGEFAFKPGK